MYYSLYITQLELSIKQNGIKNHGPNLVPCGIPQETQPRDGCQALYFRFPPKHVFGRELAEVQSLACEVAGDNPPQV